MTKRWHLMTWDKNVLNDTRGGSLKCVTLNAKCSEKLLPVKALHQIYLVHLYLIHLKLQTMKCEEAAISAPFKVD